jgi:hypothetical protein
VLAEGVGVGVCVTLGQHITLHHYKLERGVVAVCDVAMVLVVVETTMVIVVGGADLSGKRMPGHSHMKAGKGTAARAATTIARKAVSCCSSKAKEATLSGVDWGEKDVYDADTYSNNHTIYLL